MSYQTIKLTFLILATLAGIVQADVQVNKMFSNHMVLQRELKVPVWGKAEAGEQVTVKFRDQTKTVITRKDGRWEVKLEPLSLGKPGELTVKGKNNQVQFKDVLVGEVWVGSGQSNMAGRTARYAKNDSVLADMVAAGPYPNVRLYSRTGWQLADQTAINNISALHFSFGLTLHQKLKIPVGLIVGAVGGTPSGRWLSQSMAAESSELVSRLKSKGKYTLKELRQAHQINLTKWQAEVKKLRAEGKRAKRFPGPILIGDLYDRLIEPMAPYGIRGVLWDQGESGTQIPGVNQYITMQALIQGWRKRWGQGEFPFLHIQKPSGGGAAWNAETKVNRGSSPFKPQLPKNHWSNAAALAYQLNHIKMGTIKNAPLVIACDLQGGIHPANKSGYGQRASRVALGAVYGHKIVVSGPTYKSHVVQGETIRVLFRHVGDGLVAGHIEKVHGFEISGSDGKWVWADARIDGETVIVSSSQVKQPVQVQYAFSRNNNFANLYNKAGLPALMFTTVDWDK